MVIDPNEFCKMEVSLKVCCSLSAVEKQPFDPPPLHEILTYSDGWKDWMEGWTDK